MPRKKIDPESEAALEVVDLEKRKEELAVQKKQDRRRKLLEPYTDGLPYDRDRVVGEAKRHAYQSFTSAIECGKYLIWLHEEEGGQTFGQIMRQHFQHFSWSTAKNFMRLARISVEHPKLQGLIEKQRSKVIALLEILDEEDLKEFDEADSIAGMTLDDIEKTPARQLKDELRQYKKREERGKVQLVEAEGTIKDLRKQIDDLKNPLLFDSREEELLAVLRDLGDRYEQILVLIKTRIGYDNPKNVVPQSIIKKLYYLLLYIQKETLGERLNLARYYDGNDDIQWEITCLLLLLIREVGCGIATVQAGQEFQEHRKGIMAMIDEVSLQTEMVLSRALFNRDQQILQLQSQIISLQERVQELEAKNGQANGTGT